MPSNGCQNNGQDNKQVSGIHGVPECKDNECSKDNVSQQSDIFWYNHLYPLSSVERLWWTETAGKLTKSWIWDRKKPVLGHYLEEQQWNDMKLVKHEDWKFRGSK